jgi:hypothetical protein
MHEKDIFERREYFPLALEGHPLLVPVAPHGSHDAAHAAGLHQLACEAAAHFHPAPLVDEHARAIVGKLWSGELHDIGGHLYEGRHAAIEHQGEAHALVALRVHVPGQATWVKR